MTSRVYLPELAAGLDRLTPTDETLRADWEDVVGRAGKRARHRAIILNNRPVRLALAAFAVFLLLAGVATAAHLIRRALYEKQPAPSVVALDDAGRLRTIWRCPAAEDCGAFVKAVALAPDGRHLALVTGSTNGLSLYQGGLHVIDLVTGADRRMPAAFARQAAPEFELEALRRLGRSAARALGCAEPHELAWSPDGSRLAYVCAGHIYTVRPDGTGRRLLLTGTVSAYWPAWSPDGRRIAFSTKSTPVHSTIYAVDLDGSHRKLVTRAGAAPDWSPDGRTIAYWASACRGLGNENGRTRLVTPDGHDVTPHAGRRGRCGGIGPRHAIPAWAPDGHRLAVESWNGLYLMDADGTHMTAVGGTDGGTFGDSRPLWNH